MEHQLVIRNLFGAPVRVALGVVGLALVPALAHAAAGEESSSAVKVEVQSNYGKLPLSFEANQGETDSQVKFLARGRGYALFLTPTEAVLSLAKTQAHAETSAMSSPEASGMVLAMQLLGASPEPQVTGKDVLPGRVNYLRGKDPARWHTQIPTYAKVAYEGIYPGVDLVYYGNQGQLEYDFVVAPGADPGVLKLVFRGADHIEINATGELVLATASGDVRMHAPVIFQETAGVRTTIAGGYVLKEPHEVSFEMAAYDTSRPLVIDPVLVYSTYLGGSGEDLGHGIAVDTLGNAYVTGDTKSADFPTTVNAVQPTFGGDSDAFVTKLNRDGDRLLYSTYLGGSGGDIGTGIVVDELGNAYVTGDTTSADFPTVNAVQPTFGGADDAFVAKLNRNGDRLLYSTYLGGSGDELGNGIAVDIFGNAHVTGYTASQDFPTVDAVQPTFRGVFDAFVAKLDRNGDRLLYSTYLGGSGLDFGEGIAVDKLGNAYVTGVTGSTDFSTTVKAVQPTFGGGANDAFVTKLDREGHHLLYSTYLGGNDVETGLGIAVDLLGNAHVAGYTGSQDFPTTVNAVQTTFGGFADAFVVKLDRNGDRLLYSTYLGGSGFDVGRGIAVDKLGNAHVTGETNSTDFPTVDALQPTFGGVFDAFVAMLAREGHHLLYSTYLGGTSEEEGFGIAVDILGNTHIVGRTYSSNFPTMNPIQPVSAGIGDAFVVKLDR